MRVYLGALTAFDSDPLLVVGVCSLPARDPTPSISRWNSLPRLVPLPSLRTLPSCGWPSLERREEFDAEVVADVVDLAAADDGCSEWVVVFDDAGDGRTASLPRRARALLCTAFEILPIRLGRFSLGPPERSGTEVDMSWLLWRRSVLAFPFSLSWTLLFHDSVPTSHQVLDAAISSWNCVSGGSSANC